MNKSTLIRSTVAAGVAAAGLTLGGISLAAADDGGASSTTSSSSSAATGQRGPDGGPGGRHGGPGMDSAALAKALGVSEAKVTAALQAVHDQLEAGKTHDGTPPTEAERAAHDKAMATALAKKLGVSEAKVTAALTKVRAAHTAEHRTELVSRLDAAVKAGDLSSGDKASVLKAFDAGVLQPGPR